MEQTLELEPLAAGAPSITEGEPLPRVVGGTIEPNYRFPWVVDVAGTLTGKGVLISPTWVLTAAHNVDTLEQATVSYDRLDPAGRKTEGRQVSASIVRHPNYVRGRAENDVALVRLPAAFPPDPYLQPAALPVGPVALGRVGTVASFSHNRQLPTGQRAVLRGPITVERPLWFEARSTTAALHVGDSGSGFVVSNGNAHVVAGIAVRGTAQNGTQVNLPFDCTDVFAKLEWILSTTRINVKNRSGELQTPPAAGAPTAVVNPGLGAYNIVYRDTSRRLHELWRDAQGATGTARLTELAGAPPAGGNPFGYVDTARNMEILLFRDGAGTVRSLHWSTGAVGHDNLSGTARSPRAAGDPVGYYVRGLDAHHVIYRTRDGHLHELWWTGVAPVQYGGNLTGSISAPRAAGDPSPYADASGMNIVVYRGIEGHIWSVYWKDGPSGLDDLSGVAGMPLAASDPTAYYTPHNDTHQIVYRGGDGHLYELYWQGAAAVAGRDLTALSGAPAAVDKAAAFYQPGTNTKHVIYRSADNHLHDIASVPGSGTAVWIDLTVRNGAPLATDRPAAFAVEGRGTHHVVYRGTDNYVYEIRW